jgi:tetratricopeptide (TPR) repeat protein
MRNAARATVLVRAAAYALSQADYDAARPLTEESLSISRELGDRAGVARCLGTLASIAIYQNSLDEARTWSMESLAIYRELGRPLGVANTLHNLGYVALYQGDMAEAHARYDEALNVLGGTGDDRLMAHTFSDFGRVATRRTEWGAAQIRFLTALELARGLGLMREAAYALEGAAELAVAKGAPELATRMLGAAQALREGVGSPPTIAESRELRLLLDRLRGILGAEPCSAMLAAGRETPPEATMGDALDWLEHVPWATSMSVTGPS